MNYSARKEAELQKRVIPQTKKADFEEFWQREVAHLRTVPIHFERRLLTLPYKTMDAYEITFNTHDDTVVTAYFCVPKTEQKQGLPVSPSFMEAAVWTESSRRSWRPAFALFPWIPALRAEKPTIERSMMLWMTIAARS